MAYNGQIASAPATNGVIATGLPANVGNIAPNATGSTVVKYNVPPGVLFFRTNLYATATDVADPVAVYGAANAWASAYTYPTPPPGV
jgi:hypothetical protein